MREAKSTEQEKKQRTFVSSAVNVPLKRSFRCDRQCSEKTLSNWQLASVVVNEGDEAYTTCVRSVSINTCRQKEKNH